MAVAVGAGNGIGQRFWLLGVGLFSISRSAPHSEIEDWLVGDGAWMVVTNPQVPQADGTVEIMRSNLEKAADERRQLAR